MESRMLLVNKNNNKDNSNKRCFGDQQLSEIHQHAKISPTSKRSKRSAMKRVVSIPIKGAENGRGNSKSGDGGAPPADCWAWRKYGQKPIKGSPYPRGYYRCSSSKGCPARKQVERSHVDPTMLVITYSSDHNHSHPAPGRNQSTTAAANNENSTSSADQKAVSESKSGEEQEEKQVEEAASASLLTMDDEFGWLTGMESATTSFLMMEGSSLFGDDLGGSGGGASDSMLLPVMAEEDLSLFADLGELPECSAVFRRKETARAENTPYADATWFETAML